MMAPIIFKIAKKNKVFLCNFNKVQDFKENKIHKFLISQKNVKEIELLDENLTNKKLVLYFVKCLIFFFSYFPKRGYAFWKYLWLNYNFISKNRLINFIKNNKIKTISIDESLVEKKRIFLFKICKDFKIPLIMNHGGLYTLKLKLKKSKKFKECNFYLSPNDIPTYTYKLGKDFSKSKKYNQFGSPRFDSQWLSVLKKINRGIKKNSKKNIKVAIFLRPTSVSHSDNLKIIKKLKEIKNIEVKTNLKPRDVWPTKHSNLSRSEMQSSELIIWSDIVISYATSIILEAICRNKPLIYLNYLQTTKKKDNSAWFDNFKFIKKGKNLDYTIQLIKNFEKNKKIYTINDIEKKSILKKFITEPSGKGILEKYNFFYNSISHKNYNNV